jgi:hypothetical protein
LPRSWRGEDFAYSTHVCSSGVPCRDTYTTFYLWWYIWKFVACIHKCRYLTDLQRMHRICFFFRWSMCLLKDAHAYSRVLVI